MFSIWSLIRISKTFDIFTSLFSRNLIHGKWVSTLWLSINTNCDVRMFGLQQLTSGLKGQCLQPGLRVGVHLALTDFRPDDPQWTLAYGWRRIDSTINIALGIIITILLLLWSTSRIVAEYLAGNGDLDLSRSVHSAVFAFFIYVGGVVSGNDHRDGDDWLCGGVDIVSGYSHLRSAPASHHSTRGYRQAVMGSLGTLYRVAQKGKPQ